MLSKFHAIELPPRRDEPRGEINKVVARGGGGGKTDVKGRSLGLIAGETKKRVAQFLLPSFLSRRSAPHTKHILGFFLSWLVGLELGSCSTPGLLLSVVLIVISNMENMQLSHSFSTYFTTKYQRLLRIAPALDT